MITTTAPAQIVSKSTAPLTASTRGTSNPRMGVKSLCEICLRGGVNDVKVQVPSASSPHCVKDGGVSMKQGQLAFPSIFLRDL